MLSRARAMTEPGRLLSQPAIATNASKHSACAISSIESAMTSRLTSEAFIPSWPMAIASLTAMVPNSCGAPPAARTPALTDWACVFRLRLHGVTSFHELATPTNGRRRSSSESPVARSMARWGARSTPSVTVRLRCLRSTSGAVFTTCPPY